jgi:hypothetical protein
MPFSFYPRAVTQAWVPLVDVAQTYVLNGVRLPRKV